MGAGSPCKCSEDFLIKSHLGADGKCSKCHHPLTSHRKSTQGGPGFWIKLQTPPVVANSEQMINAIKEALALNGTQVESATFYWEFETKMIPMYNVKVHADGNICWYAMQTPKDPDQYYDMVT